MNFTKITKITQLKGGRRKVKFLAGGTNIFPLLSDGMLEEENFCDISTIGELKKIKVLKNTVSIGALVTFFQIKERKILGLNCLLHVIPLQIFIESNR